MGSERTLRDKVVMTKSRIEKRIADGIAFVFTIVILVYAASGPVFEFVWWLIEVATAGFDDPLRCDQRLIFREY